MRAWERACEVLAVLACAAIIIRFAFAYGWFDATTAGIAIAWTASLWARRGRRAASAEKGRL